MKTKFFFFAMLISITASAQVTNVEPVGATYANKTVSFRVWWNAGSRDATHLSKVWVWVDYITMNSNNTTSGNTWARAAVSSASPTASVSYDGSNRQGFWLQGATSGSYSATVTVQLNITASKFNWCAYASDCPPNAKITAGTYSNGTYTLKGTKPFVINNSIIVDATTYSSGNITTITDATQCPGDRCNLKDEAVGTLGCCAGLIAYNGYCRDLSALNFEVAATEIGPMLYANRNQCPAGWRLPTTVELKQMWNYKNELNLCTNGYLWAAGPGTYDQSCNCDTNTQYYLCCTKGCGCSNTPNLPAGSTSTSGCCQNCIGYIRCIRNK
jgi:hypothetical protein